MTFDHELTLIDVVHSENDIGDPITYEERTDVLCSVQSVTRSEHYAAAAHGLQPEVVFVVNQYDYNGQKYAEFENQRYQVIRAYKPRKAKGIGDFETVELVCKGWVNNATT